jgi:hypothetical protein
MHKPYPNSVKERLENEFVPKLPAKLYLTHFSKPKQL